MIDNQVQQQQQNQSGDYSTHSPASSSHSGCGAQTQQVYDKIGNLVNSSVSTKSLLQPLKSFTNNQTNQNSQMGQIQPPSSISIPNTPAKYCESNFYLIFYFFLNQF